MGWIGRSIEAMILQALAFQAQGQIGQALLVLDRALALAEPEGYVRIFIDEGAPMGDLLRQAAARGISINYVNGLLTALQADQDHKASLLQPSALSPQPLIELLTDRELEVLGCRGFRPVWAGRRDANPLESTTLSGKGAIGYEPISSVAEITEVVGVGAGYGCVDRAVFLGEVPGRARD